MWEMIGMDIYNKRISDFEYEAKYDLKVATGKKVVEHVLEKYGDKSIRSIVNDANEFELLENYVNYNDHNDERKNLIDISEDLSIKRNLFYENVIKKHGDEIFDDFEKQNYDAIVDIEDWVSDNGVYGTEYPIILLDPQKSIKLRKETLKH